MPTTFFGWVGFLVERYGPLFLQGTANTLIIALSGTFTGFALGLLVAIARTIELPQSASPLKVWLVKCLKTVLSAYIEVFRGTPMIVQAAVIYYGLQSAGVALPQMTAGIVVVSINTGAYMAEIIRGGIISIDKGQTEAARSIGMTHWQTMTGVVLPQAIRNIMPSIGNEFVVNIKDSSVLNVISVSELFFMGKSAAGVYYRYFEAYFIIAVIYLVLTFTVTRLLRLLEKKMDGPDNYVIYGSQSDSRAEIHVAAQKEGI
ncbi:MAG: amino acid ABC transporter permease [Clostridia bacterium]|nr:amino acid ABC transporter permease [Clostridia bacterium]